MLNSNDKNEILNLLKDYYTDKFSAKAELALFEPNGSEKHEYLMQFPNILPINISKNVSFEFEWLNKLTTTITIDYILESGFSYVLIFLDKAQFEKSKYDEMRKFAIAHKMSLNKRSRDFYSEYVFIYFNGIKYNLHVERERSLNLWHLQQKSKI